MYPIYPHGRVNKDRRVDLLQQANRISSPMLSKSRQKFSEFLIEEGSKSFNVSFSKHAAKRITQRQIVLSFEQMEKLANGLVKLKEKGVKEGLVLCGDLAFVVNPTDRRVITCIDRSGLKEDVFTNIDGVVIMQ